MGFRRVCKWCSFECDMGKYSVHPINKVWAYRRTLPANTRPRPNVGPPSTTLAQHCVDVSCLLGIHLTCAVLWNGMKNEQQLFFLIWSRHAWLTSSNYNKNALWADKRLIVKKSCTECKTVGYWWMSFAQRTQEIESMFKAQRWDNEKFQLSLV